MQSAITISLVPQARGGPFVFWEDLDAAAADAGKLGFDGLEVFAPGPHAAPSSFVKSALGSANIRAAAVGTGACWVLHRWTLTSTHADVRASARAFIREIIGWGAELNAPAIIGSAQGRYGDDVSREKALDWFCEALSDLGAFANKLGATLLIEPLNRYETNVMNRLDQGVEIIQKTGHSNIKLLADLFHMNIEESNSPLALKNAAPYLGHVHLADSDRGPCGSGHIAMNAVGEALALAKYKGFISAECLPKPDSITAAQMTISGYQKHFKPASARSL